jgi:ACS family hexuronate transporter-like MFS transporter
MIGMVAWIPFLAADIGGPGGGALSDYLIRRGWNPSRARRTMMAVAACLTPAAMLAVRVDVAWQALALIAIVVAAQSCWMANQLTFISESVERQNVGTMLSLSALGGSLGGILSTLIAGRVIESFGYTPVFTALGLLHVTAFCIITFAVRLARNRAAAGSTLSP